MHLQNVRYGAFQYDCLSPDRTRHSCKEDRLVELGLNLRAGKHPGIAAFGQKLRDEDQVANYPIGEIEKLASASRGEDPLGYRGEFLKMVRLAQGLTPQ